MFHCNLFGLFHVFCDSNKDFISLNFKILKSFYLHASKTNTALGQSVNSPFRFTANRARLQSVLF